MRNKTPFLVMIIGISFMIGAANLTRGHEWGDDFASYIMQAESVLRGQTQNFVDHNAFTIFESSNQIGPVAYPWGYPLSLVPIYAIKGNHPLALKLPGLFFYAAFLVCLYLLIKTRFTPSESLLVTVLFAFNPLLLGYLDYIASDIPFLFFSTLSLLIMVSNGHRAMIQNVTLGLAIAGAFFTRTTGILLLASYLAMQVLTIWDNRKNQVTVKKQVFNSFIVVLLLVSSWVLYALIFPGGGESYFAQYKDFKINTVFRLASDYFQVFGLFFDKQGGWNILYYALVPFFLIGCWKHWKPDLLFILFFLLWMIVLITWPFWQGPRFIFPLLPLFIYFTFVGMKFVLSKLSERFWQSEKWMFYGFWVSIALFFLFTSVKAAYTNIQADRSINGPYDPYSKEVYTFIKEKTAADSVVIFFKPRAMRLMTGHDSILALECDRILKGDVLVLNKKVGKNQQIPPEEIGACNLPLKEVLSNTRFVVYEIKK